MIAPAARPPRLPALRWARTYNPGVLRADAIAGVTLAAYLLPAAIGDASLAGLPAQAGIYACLFSGLIFWLLCGSRHTAITVTSAISLLLGTSLGALASGDASRYWALAACTALLVSAMALGAWLLHAGSLVSFVSESVLVGFKTGVALVLASTQLPKLFGISGSHGNFWERSRHFLTHLGETNRGSLLIGLAALGVLILGRIYLRHKPVALLVVIGGIVVSGVLGLEARGVKVLGEVPQGLPVPRLPPVAWSDLNDLLPLAMACFLLGAVETAAIGRMFAAKHGGRLDANQELLALAGANLAAGLGHGFPVSGGMSQSLVNEGAGARTPASGLVAALLVLVVAVAFTGMLHSLPQPVLAAVVLMAVFGLVNIPTLKHLWRTDRTEFTIAAAALAGVLASGLLRGVLIGAVISLLLLIRRASRPHVAFLGRAPGTRRFTDLSRHPENRPVPGVLLFRPEGALVYFNADHVRDVVLARARSTEPATRLVVCDLSASPHMDLAGAEMLKGLAAELRTIGASLRIVDAHAAVRDRLLAEGLLERPAAADRSAPMPDLDEIIATEAASHEARAGAPAGAPEGAVRPESQGDKGPLAGPG